MVWRRIHDLLLGQRLGRLVPKAPGRLLDKAP
jgi:hypothetical protein